MLRLQRGVLLPQHHLLCLRQRHSFSRVVGHKQRSGVQRRTTKNESSLVRFLTVAFTAVGRNIETIVKSLVTITGAELIWELKGLTPALFTEAKVGADEICSPEFEACGHKWKLKAYLGGNSEEEAGHVSVYFNLMSPDAVVNADYSLHISGEDAAFFRRSARSSALANLLWAVAAEAGAMADCSRTRISPPALRSAFPAAC